MIRNSILYNGISEYIPDDINSFTQMNINQVMAIDEKLPEIDEILKVSVTSNIKDQKIVKTAIGTSLEGQNLTGFKLLSEGEFYLRIDYCSNDLNSCIYTFKNTIFFNNATTLSNKSNENSRVIVSIYIEDIYAEKICNREILININFIFTTENY